MTDDSISDPARGDLRGLGLAIGPAAFVTAWVVGGARTPGYSPVNDAISRIAEVGAPHAATMTAGFVVYGASVMVGSLALRASPLRSTWLLAAINGAATLGVALTPLERSSTVDALHGLSAAIGYGSIAAIPIVGAPAIRRLGHRRLAAASTGLGVLIAASLVATTMTDANGLFQRLGLTAGDVWLVGAGIWLARRSAGR